MDADRAPQLKASVGLLPESVDVNFLKIVVVAFALLTTQLALSQQNSLNIHSVDFRNRSYPWSSDLINPASRQKTFILRDGQRSATRDKRGFIDDMGVILERVIYGDVTGDGVEDAVVTMSIQTGGSMIPGLVYIYSLRGNRPTLLWHFSTGDRANGGLHGVSAQRGELIVEVNGPKHQNEGDCCAGRFTRRHYVWRGNRFRQKGKEEIIPLSPKAID